MTRGITLQYAPCMRMRGTAALLLSIVVLGVSRGDGEACGPGRGVCHAALACCSGPAGCGGSARFCAESCMPAYNGPGAVCARTRRRRSARLPEPAASSDAVRVAFCTGVLV